MVAIWVTGAPRKLLGENTITKLIPRLCQSRVRRLATRAVRLRPSTFVNERIKALGVGGLDIEKEERRRFLGQRRQELAAQVAVDFDHGDEERKPEPEREHDADRKGAGAVNVGDRQSQNG